MNNFNYPQMYSPQMTQPQMYPQYSQQSQQIPTTLTVAWTQGDVGATAYPVAPGNSVLLMDSDGQYFYMKTADNMGRLNMKKYAYHEVVGDSMRNSYDRNMDTSYFADREEVKELQKEVHSLKEELSRLQNTDGGNK